MKKFFIFLLVLAILGAGGYFGYDYYQQHYAQPVASTAASAYTEHVIGRGDLTKSVTGTGTLSIARTEDVALAYAVTITETLVEEGDTVTAGQPLMRIDTSLLQTAIDTLQTELETTESSIADMADDYDIAKTLTMPLYGRVKEVYIEEGMYIQDVMAQRGCIALLSLDGRMYVEIPAVEGLEISDTVRVRADGHNVTGTVRALEDGMARITFSDAYGVNGHSVTVTRNGVEIGSGTSYIHMPYELTTAEQGYIEEVYIEVDGRRWAGGTVCYIVGIPISDSFRALEATRAKQAAQLNEMKALLASGVITAPADGIISTVTAASATEQVAYTVLASLYVGDEKEMVLSVDELDIINVRVGQNVDVAMDAIEGKTYPATVTKVSQIGTATSGVTVYNVTITINGDEQLRFGMNGTATIHIEELNDVLLVPLTALNTSRGASYVWVKTSADTGDEPGVRTAIETGLSDENYAQVVSGLSEGDVVLITREASTNDATNRRNGFGGMPGMGGGSMPAGGAMPSGGSRGNGGGRPGN